MIKLDADSDVIMHLTLFFIWPVCYSLWVDYRRTVIKKSDLGWPN